MTVREYLQAEIVTYQEKATRLTELLYNIPPQLDGKGVGELESDSVLLFGDWLILNDKSHKDLGSRLATITGQSYRFEVTGTTRTAVFRDVGPFYKVDLDRPNPKCRKVRALRVAKEVTLEICGDLPAGYELLEELDESA